VGWAESSRPTGSASEFLFVLVGLEDSAHPTESTAMFRNALFILKHFLLLLVLLIPAVPVILIAFVALLGIVFVTLMPAVWRTPLATYILITGFSAFTLLFGLLLTF